MALIAFLRCTSGKRSLLAGVAVWRSLRFYGSVTNIQHRRITYPLGSRIFLPFHLSSFSYKANRPACDADLVRVIDAEIKCAEECDDHDRVEEIAEGFPFQIQDEKGMNIITLRRNYHGEDIEVLVSMPSIVTGEDPENIRRVGGNDEDNRDKLTQSSIPLTINVSKHKGHGLEFCCTAYPDELIIDSMSFSEIHESSEEMLAYEGPDFSDLDENLQKAFYKYLELRGISAMTTNFLHEYMINKDSSEYLFWLKNLKKFIEK
ncbi:hypothetical protein HPP92_015011 [Vanilla planifolia]|uniref:Mitochondrial glycoprotein n=1 Tax=Vanilla planifolia TaxID=51239 RepID=A0A835QL36_VANPL|nr:hypothetical protein HPP92_015011 [Vanilla planifolia]